MGVGAGECKGWVGMDIEGVGRGERRESVVTGFQLVTRVYSQKIIWHLA